MSDERAGRAVVEVASDRRRRRRQWALAEKLSIVGEIAASGDPVAEVARRHRVNANQLFAWRQLVRTGSLGGPPAARAAAEFVEVGLVGAPVRRPEGGERIEIVLPNGVVVRAPASVTGEPLRAALSAAIQGFSRERPAAV
ncbi:MAG TPA: transposase [Caulobacteraceae bacterium]|nr:transposase [Caulobacteraceae bacterium]